MKKEEIIQELFEFSRDIRYVAIYDEQELLYRQRQSTLTEASSGDTDRFEELLVNPTVLKLTEQRGNIDCGGLDYLLIGYGNFFQLVKSIPRGHVSVCLEKKADLNILPQKIFDFLEERFPEFL